MFCYRRMNGSVLLLFFGCFGFCAHARDVLILGGTPSSRESLRTWGAAGDALGIRTHLLERPGFGDTPPSERSFEHWQEIVVDYLRQHRINDFAVVGISGGGPHALACGLLPNCNMVVLVSSCGPYEAFIDSPLLSPFNRSIFRAARAKDRAEVTRLLETRPDLRRFDPAAFKQGTDPSVDELILLMQPWPFPLADIRCSVHAFHGATDSAAPVTGLDGLATQLPSFAITLFPDRGHDIGRTDDEKQQILMKAAK